MDQSEGNFKILYNESTEPVMKMGVEQMCLF